MEASQGENSFGNMLALSATWALGRVLSGRRSPAGPASAGRARLPAAAQIHAGTETGAGAGADSPTGIPATGWWDVAKRAYASFSRNRLMAVAAGVTFYALLAIFPGIAAFVSIYGLFANVADINAQLDTVSGLLPGKRSPASHRRGAARWASGSRSV
jgi:membrane protein